MFKLSRLFKRKPKAPPPFSVLFVCTANIKRSPVAEAIFRQMAEKAGETWKVASAGVNAGRGIPVNQIISFIMFQRGLSLNFHRSQPVDKKLLSEYQWIVTMEEAHREELIKIDENAKDRILLFRELSGDEELMNMDMPDPTGKDADDYRDLFEIFDSEMPRLINALRGKAYEVEYPGDEY